MFYSPVQLADRHLPTVCVLCRYACTFERTPLSFTKCVRAWVFFLCVFTDQFPFFFFVLSLTFHFSGPRVIYRVSPFHSAVRKLLCFFFLFFVRDETEHTHRFLIPASVCGFYFPASCVQRLCSLSLLTKKCLSYATCLPSGRPAVK